MAKLSEDQYGEIIDLISAGEIEGLVDGKQGVYFDKSSLADNVIIDTIGVRPGKGLVNNTTENNELKAQVTAAYISSIAEVAVGLFKNITITPEFPRYLQIGEVGGSSEFYTAITGLGAKAANTDNETWTYIPATASSQIKIKRDLESNSFTLDPINHKESFNGTTWAATDINNYLRHTIRFNYDTYNGISQGSYKGRITSIAETNSDHYVLNVSPAVRRNVAINTPIKSDFISKIISKVSDTEVRLENTVPVPTGASDKVHIRLSSPVILEGKEEAAQAGLKFPSATAHLSLGKREPLDSEIMGSSPSVSIVHPDGTELKRSIYSGFGSSGGQADHIIESSEIAFGQNTASEMDELQVLIEFPAGLRHVTENGNDMTAFAEFQIIFSYLPLGSDAYTNVLVAGKDYGGDDFRESVPAWSKSGHDSKTYARELVYGYQARARYAKPEGNADYRGTTGTGENAIVNSGVVAKFGNRPSFVAEFTHKLTSYQPFSKFKIIFRRMSPENGVDYSNDNQSFSGLSRLKHVQFSIFDKLSYPLTAVAKVGFSAKDFKTVPERAYHIKGKKVKVPTNYFTRDETQSLNASYSRIASTNTSYRSTHTNYVTWDGTFRGDTNTEGSLDFDKVYTNNPAWIFYDILTDIDIGLGDFIKATDVDKYALYQIARYCDELVPDGKGGQEPRFTCNVYLGGQEEAYKVLKDLATVFRSMMFWIDGKITLIQDSPKEPVYTFTQANIVNGMFEYTYTGQRARVNQVNVTWNNPDEFYKKTVVTIEDAAHIAQAKFITSKDIVAFGCTSESQAERLGLWHIATESKETEIVSFTTGINASFLRPGDIINVQDKHSYNIEKSGRILADADTDGPYSLDRTVTFGPGSEVGTDCNLILIFSEPGIYLAQDSAIINEEPYTRGALLLENATPITFDPATETDAANLVDDDGNAVATHFSKNIRTETKAISNTGTTSSSITITGNFSSSVAKDTIWAIQLKDTSANVDDIKKFRILSITEDNEEYSITASKYVETKFDEIEYEKPIYTTDYNVIPASGDTVPAPTNLNLELVPKDNTNAEIATTYRGLVTWTPPMVGIDSYGNSSSEPYKHLSHYRLQINSTSEDNAEAVVDTRIENAASSSFFVDEITSGGTYEVILYAVGSFNKPLTNVSPYNTTTTEAVSLPVSIERKIFHHIPRYNRIDRVAKGGQCDALMTKIASTVSFNNTTFSFEAPSGIDYSLTGTQEQNFNGLTSGQTGYLYFDASAIPHWKNMLVHIDTTVEDARENKINITYLKEAGAPTNGLTAITGSSPTIAAYLGSSKITGTGTSFFTDFNVGDLIKLSDNSSAGTETVKSEYKRVVEITSNTSLLVHTPFIRDMSSWTTIYAYKQTFLPDIEFDAILAKVVRSGSDYTLTTFATFGGDITGLVTYTWTKYASNDDGTTGFTNTYTEGVTTYVGMAFNKTSATESTTPGDYIWSKLQGDPGVTYYTWIKYATNDDGTAGFANAYNPTVTTYVGYAYGKTEVAESDDAEDYTWSRLEGVNADNKFTWVKYGTDSSGAGLTDTYTAGTTTYIGMAFNKTTATESTTVGDYTWTKIEGEDGVTTYTWTKYASNDEGTSNFGNTYTAGTTTYIGMAFNKTTATESTDPTDYIWTKIEGADGVTYYTWIKYATNATGTTGFTNTYTAGTTTYVGYAYGKITATESTTPGDYIWSRLEGVNADNKFTWVKYGTDSSGAGLTDTYTAGTTTYIGMAFNKTTATESTTVGDYTWTKIEGDDGVTTYTWVKYATSSAGAGLTGTYTQGTTTYIGMAFNKTSATASTNTGDYTWTKIEGADGAPGLNTATVSLYRKNSSNSTPPAAFSGDFTYTFADGEVTNGTLNSWTTAVPGLSNASGAEYVWVRQATASNSSSTDTVPTSEFSAAVIHSGIGANGDSIVGAAGNSNSLVPLYRVSTSGTSAPTSFTGEITYTYAGGGMETDGDFEGWTNTIPTVAPGSFLWVRQATASSNTSTDTIAIGEWSAAAVTSASGADGVSVKTESLFQKGASAPSYSATAGSYADPDNGNASWSYTMAALADDEKMWAITRSFNSDNSSTANWTTPVNILTRTDGTNASPLTITSTAANTPSAGRTTITFSDSSTVIIDDGTNGDDGDGIDIIYKNSSSAITSAPAASSSSPSGWSFVASATASGERQYISIGVRTNNTGNYTWSIPSVVTAIDGSTGASVNLVFIRAGTAPTTPSTSTGVPTSWADSPPSGTDFLWASHGEKGVGATHFTWTTPYQVEGAAHAEVYIYRKNNSGAPSGGSYKFADNSNVLTVPSNWANAPQALTTDGDKVYVSVGLATGAVTAETASISWSTPVIYAERQDGSTGASVNIVFARATSAPSTPTASSGIPSANIQWYDSPPGGTELLWASRGEKGVGDTNFTWTTPFQAEGAAHVEVYIYRKNNSGAPSGGSYNFTSNSLTVPSNWAVSPQALTTDGDKVYVSVGLATGASTATAASISWSTPVVYAERQDGTSVTVSSSATDSSGNTVVTFSDGNTATISKGDTQGVIVCYASDANGTGKSFTQGTLTYVKYHEYNGTAPVIGDSVFDSGFVRFIGIDGDPEGVKPIYAADASGTSASFTQGTLTFINFYEWTVNEPTSVPGGLTYIRFIGEDGTSYKYASLYSLNDSAIGTTTAGTFASPENGAESGWTIAPPAIGTTDGNKIYVTTRTFSDPGGGIGTWSTPTIYSHYTIGATGAGTNFVFARAATKPNVPTANGLNIPSANIQWYDAPPSGQTFLWSSKGTVTAGGTAYSWGAVHQEDATLVAEIRCYSNVVASAGAAPDKPTASIYNATTSSIALGTAPNELWNLTPPSVTNDGDTVYSCTSLVSGAPLDESIDISWEEPAIFARKTDGTSVTVSSSATDSSGNTVVTFSDGNTATISKGDTQGVIVCYASDANGTGKSFTQGTLTYVKYHEYNGTAPVIGDSVFDSGFVRFIGTSAISEGIKPIYAADASGTSASFTQGTLTFINFYEWTGTEITEIPESLTYVKFVGDTGASTTTIYYLKAATPITTPPSTPSTGTDSTPGDWTATVSAAAANKSRWFSIGNKAQGSDNWVWGAPQIYQSSDNFAWGTIAVTEGLQASRFTSLDGGTTFSSSPVTGELSIVHPTLGTFKCGFSWTFNTTSDTITAFALSGVGSNPSDDYWSSSTFAAGTSEAITVTHQSSGYTIVLDCSVLTITLGGGGSCFLPGTLVEKENGIEIEIENLEIGDKVRGGTIIDKQSYQTDYWYKLNGLNLTAGHPVWIEDKGWSCIDPEDYYKECKEFGHKVDLDPKRIEVGDKTTAGEIDLLERIEGQQEVWNITVDIEHTYYVNGILVHNGGK